MNEDFGAGPRRHVNDFNGPQRPATINIDKYRPTANLGPARPQGQQLPTLPRPQQPTDITDASNWNRSANPLVAAAAGQTASKAATSGAGGDSGSGPTSNSNGFDDEQPWYKRPFVFLSHLSRKQWLIIAAAFLVLVGGGMSYALTRPDDGKPAPKVAKQAPKPAPEPIVSPLTGLEVSEEDSKRPVIAVMVENSTFARPQSGLQQAGVVYEAIAEYGITRFMALYQEAAPGNIGPVRSARPYFADWARSYDAAYGHVGGSPDGLQRIKEIGVRDIDQFANSGSYHRINSREAPHNVYTSMNDLRSLVSGKGWNSSNFTAWPRKKEAKAAQPTAQRIDIGISGPTYNVHYDYDAASNSYLRTMAGAEHKDNDSGARIAPKVVIGMATQYGLMSDGYHSTYATTGSGTAKVFQDGLIFDATWTREGNDTYKFKDANGELKLNPGQVWLSFVGDPAAISFKP